MFRRPPSAKRTDTLCPYTTLSRSPARERVLISNWRRAMTRVVSLFLPTWSTDRVRRKAGDTAPPAEAPLVLIGHDGRRRVVVAADVAAQDAGLRVGMPATKAQVLVPGLLVQARSEAQTSELKSLI